MVSIKVKYRSSTASGKEGGIYYQIIHGCIVRQIKTDFHVFETEWDNEISSVRIIPEINEKRKLYLLEVARRIEWDIKRFWAIIAQNDRQGSLYIVEKTSRLENNRLGSRTIDEGSMDEKSGMNFSEYVAILSGNTDLLEKAKSEKKIAGLESEQHSFMRSRQTSRSRLSRRRVSKRVRR